MLSLRSLILLLAVVCTFALSLPLFGNAASLNAADTDPTWYVDAPVLYRGQAEPYDHYAVKDPTIVYSGGKYHVFYTGANSSGGWQTLYSSATTLEGLRTASHIYLSGIGESYFCAPQVFYFEPDGLWYLVYQDGTYGAAYATSTNIADPSSWSGPQSFGVSGKTGWDYYVICDDTYCYMYNTPDDSSHNIYMRKTTVANFPTGWGSPSVAVADTFEGVAVYKSLSNGLYYLIVEDLKDNRYYELWTSSGAGGPWTQVAEKWAWYGNLVYNSDQWTTSVSHGEFIRAGVNQELEITDINHVDFLIQGTLSLSGEYQQIPWDIGVIRNYTGTDTDTDTCTTVPETPTGLTATAASSSRINLTWTAVDVPGCSVTYSVYQSTTDGFMPSSSNLEAIGLTSASYSSIGLADSTTYYFRVQAVDAAGSSELSSQADATTLDGETGDGETGTTPCENAITMTSGQSGNFNTTDAVCLRTSATIAGWGCSNFDGRTVAVNNVAVSCGEMPLPAKWSDGYYYFSVSAGSYPWASLYYW